MKKIFSILINVSLVILFMTGFQNCKNESVEQAATPITDVPPSLKDQTQAKKIVIELSADQIKTLNIPVHQISLVHKHISIVAPGEVTPAPNYLAIISAPVEGRVLQLPVNEGDKIKKGQVFLELESLTYGSLVADYLQAKAEENYQSSQLNRIQQLVQKGINPESELERVKADYARSQASIQAAYAKLRAVGTTDGDINQLGSTQNINPRLKVLSPINGIVDTHNVELGQAVDANQQIATVVDLNKVLVKSYISPEEGRLVAPGDSVEITHRLLEGQVVWGVVRTINPGLDQANKSVVVNTFIDNRDGWLKPGDNIRTQLYTQATRNLISIPIKAVTYNNDESIVFVKVDATHYEMRKIIIEEIRNEVALISSGLSEGELIAIGQVFSLKALARYELIAEE